MAISDEPQAAVLANQAKWINNRSHSDVKLIVQGNIIYAHSFPLLSQSKYFETALSERWNNGCKSVEVKLDCDIVVAHAIISYCYSGKAKVAITADFLDITNLFHFCFNQLSDGNAIALFQLSFQLEKFDLADRCIRGFPLDWSTDANFLAILSHLEIQYILFSPLIESSSLARWKTIINWSNARSESQSENSASILLRLLEQLAKCFIRLNFSLDDYDMHVKPFLYTITDIGLQKRIEKHTRSFAISDITLFPSSVLISVISNSRKLFSNISELILEMERSTGSKSSISSVKSSSSYFIAVLSSNASLKWSLLFRASEHSFNAEEFHRLCDNKGPTLTLIKSDNGRIAAAYNCKSWTSDRALSMNATGFIAAVDSDVKVVKFKARSNEGCSYNAWRLGPNFCSSQYSSFDLSLVNNCHANSGSYSSLGNGYIGPDASDTRLFGTINFKVAEYEVFKIDSIQH